MILSSFNVGGINSFKYACLHNLSGGHVNGRDTDESGREAYLKKEKKIVVTIFAVFAVVILLHITVILNEKFLRKIFTRNGEPDRGGEMLI